MTQIRLFGNMIARIVLLMASLMLFHVSHGLFIPMLKYVNERRLMQVHKSIPGKDHNIFYRRKELSSERSASSLHMTTAQNVDGFTEAFIGGSVGVMSVAIIVELQKLKGKSLEGCPYCMGTGVLLCAQCCGCGKSCDISGNVINESIKCLSCEGSGLVQCLNCQGDGRVTPMVLQSKAVRDPDYAEGVNVDPRGL